jgi:uncharacterized protein (TIGR02145 family)
MINQIYFDNMKKINKFFVIVFVLIAMLFNNCASDNDQYSVEHENSKIEEIEIGQQIWMLENLDVSHYRNGDSIPEVKTKEEWHAAGDKGLPVWCYYENVKSNGEKYGKLYNWYAINNSRGLAPEGWHIPDIEEWMQLDNYLGRNEAGIKLKNTSDWNSDKNGSNESGFTALPGGFRDHHGTCTKKGDYGIWWCAVDENGKRGESYTAIMVSDSGLVYIDGKYLFKHSFTKAEGFSVRCVKD